MSISGYVGAAMRRDVYEILPEEEGIYGEIADLRGVYANALSLEVCREELQSVLEDWLLVKLRRDDIDIPVLDGMDLNEGRPVE